MNKLLKKARSCAGKVRYAFRDRVFFLSRKNILACDLKDVRESLSSLPVQFRIGTFKDFESMSVGSAKWDISPALLPVFERRLQEGDTLIIGEETGGEETGEGSPRERARFYLWMAHGRMEVTLDKMVTLDPEIGFGYKVFCHPDYRGRGLMGACYTSIKTEMADKGIRTIYITIDQENIGSLVGHQKLGFQLLGEHYYYLRIFGREYALLTHRIPRSRSSHSPLPHTLVSL
jgi:GNAT superfamily N-acetyltransferase